MTEIRQATTEDTEILSWLGRETYCQAFPDLWDNKENRAHYLDESFSPSSIRKQLAEKGVSFFLLFSESEPVGYIKIRKEDKELELVRIYLLGKARGKGIGWYGLQFIEKIQENEHFEKIRLEVLKSNQSAIDFYKRNGFHIHSEKEFIFETSQDQLLILKK